MADLLRQTEKKNKDNVNKKIIYDGWDTGLTA